MVNSNDHPTLTLRIKGENMLAEHYQEVFGFQTPGRSLTIGATAHIN